MKRILAFFSVIAITVAALLPTTAFAASLSASEQKVLDKFEAELDYWVKNTNFPEDHKEQYYHEAKNALLAVDLSDTGCTEFEGAIDEIHQIFKKYDCKTAHDLWEHHEEIAKCINDIGAKYYKLTITFYDGKNTYDGKNGTHWAKVTWTDQSGTTHTVATTGGSVVKQTGFDLTRTAVVTVASGVVLVGAYFIARKMRLFA